jgi:hypothetical protein
VTITTDAPADARTTARSLPPHLAALLDEPTPQAAVQPRTAGIDRRATAQAAAAERFQQALARREQSKAELATAQRAAADAYGASYVLDKMLAVTGPITVHIERIAGEPGDSLTLRWGGHTTGDAPDNELTDPREPIEGLDGRLAQVIATFDEAGVVFLAEQPERVRAWVKDASRVVWEGLAPLSE